MSAELQRSEKLCAELRTQKGALERRVKELEDELRRLRASLEETQRLHQMLQQQVETLKRDLAAREANINRLEVERRELLLRIKSLEERPATCHIQTQTDDLRPLLDPANLMFQGVCAQVSAQQLHDCGLLKAPTLEQLRKSERSVDEVDAQLQPALRGARVIAGMAAGPTGKIPLAEALKQKLLSRESALRLLEAQAATGGLMDPTSDAHRRRRVEEGQATGLVPTCSRDRLLEAETACLGIRDPATGKPLGVGQAHRRGLRDEAVTLQLLQAQEAVGGVLDPRLSVFLPRDLATDRNLLDKELYTALNARPASYLHPLTQRPCTYTALQDTCIADPSTGHLLLPSPKAVLAVQGLRADVPVWELVGVGQLEPEDLEHLLDGRLCLDDIQLRLRAYLRECGSVVAGVLEQSSGRILTLQEAQQAGMLNKEVTLELLEAQIACGFLMDPREGRAYTVEEAHQKGLIGAEYKEALLKAEKAVTGYSQPGGGPMLCLSEALQRGLVERRYGLRLLGAQLASGAIVDPWLSIRIPPETATQRGLLAQDLREALDAQGDISWGFSDPTDPNNKTKFTYAQLLQECKKDPKTSLLLLPATVPSQKNTVRKRRVVIVDPDTGREMTIKQAFESKLIDYETYVELAQQECEWEEITITAADGSKRLVIVDRTQGLEYDVQDLIEKGVIRQAQLDQYRAGTITLAQLVDAISLGAKPLPSASGLKNATQTSTSSTTSSTTSCGTKASNASMSSNSATHMATSSAALGSTTSTASPPKPSSTYIKSQTMATSSVIISSSASSTSSGSISGELAPLSPSSPSRVTSMSVHLASPIAATGERNPVGAIFDSETLEKVSITEAMSRGLVDNITGQRLLEAQACTGGLVCPTSGRRLSLQEAQRIGLVKEDLASRLRPAQKAYVGFSELQGGRRLSVAEAVKERWLPHEAGQRFLEFQQSTGGLWDPQDGCRRSLEEAQARGWVDARSAQKLSDLRQHARCLTCPRSSLKLSYAEALERCLLEESTGILMLPAMLPSSTPGSRSGSRPGSCTGSRSGSRRGSADLSSSSSSIYTSFSYSSYTTGP